VFADRTAVQLAEPAIGAAQAEFLGQVSQLLQRLFGLRAPGGLVRERVDEVYEAATRKRGFFSEVASGNAEPRPSGTKVPCCQVLRRTSPVRLALLGTPSR